MEGGFSDILIHFLIFIVNLLWWRLICLLISYLRGMFTNIFFFEYNLILLSRKKVMVAFQILAWLCSWTFLQPLLELQVIVLLRIIMLLLLLLLCFLWIPTVKRWLWFPFHMQPECWKLHQQEKSSILSWTNELHFNQ